MIIFVMVIYLAYNESTPFFLSPSRILALRRYDNLPFRIWTGIVYAVTAYQYQWIAPSFVLRRKQHILHTERNMNRNKQVNLIWGNWNWEKWVTIDMLHPMSHVTHSLVPVSKDRRLPQPYTCDWSNSYPCHLSTSASMEQARASPALPSSPLRQRTDASWSTAHSSPPSPLLRHLWDHFPVAWLDFDQGVER